MSYLGRGLEQVDNISKLDNITFNGGTTYALTKDSAAFTPISSNAILISIDGVVQQGNFSVSGTNIVFNFSPTSSNTCDFILHYGTGVAFTPADNSITKDKTNFVSTSSSAGLQIKGDGTTDGTLQLNCSQNSHGVKIKSPAHSAGQSYTLTLPGTAPASNKIMQTDGSGNLSFVDAPSGTHVKLLAGSASSAVNHDLVGFISSTYHCYLVLLSKVTGLQGNTLDFQFADSGGPFTASNYWDAAHGFRSNSSDRFTQGGENSAQARLGSGLDASSNRTGSYFFYIYVNPNSAAFSCSASGHNWGYRADYGDYIHADFTLGMDNTNTVTGFRVHAQGNDATTFDYQIYGIAK